MRCIFCKQVSSSSISVEHIVPESLWNTQHILPAGVVCDACNNYFSRKVEKPFLESDAISRLRFDQGIPSKRGRIPSIAATLYPGHPIELHRYAEGDIKMSLSASPGAIKQFFNSNSNYAIIPATPSPPEDRVISRFLAKMAVEAMAHRLFMHDGGLDYLIDEVQLNPIRKFARYGEPRMWPLNIRRIYPANRKIVEPNGNALQTVHEFDFLVTDHNEWYFVFVLFGLELVINLGGPVIEGYLTWLKKNHEVSPLYHGKNAKCPQDS